MVHRELPMLWIGNDRESDDMVTILWTAFGSYKLTICYCVPSRGSDGAVFY